MAFGKSNKPASGKSGSTSPQVKAAPSKGASTGKSAAPKK
ncbi:MAG: hypothetical protein Tsb0032_41350 [Kiloniellaceae bacterium]